MKKFSKVKKYNFQKTTSILLAVLLVFQFALPMQVLAATKSWDFTTSSDYTFDNTKIEFSSGQAQLKATSTPTWYNTSWKYRKKIIIDHTKVSGDLTNFPVLISRTDTDWKDTGNGGYVGQSDGGDFVFTSSDGTTALNYEIEKYTSTSGELVAWVKIPTLSSVSDTDIYIYYGNVSVADQQNSVGVWDSNYQVALHLDESPANNINGHIDSTGNLYNATPYNFGSVPNSTTDGTGKIDGGDTFDGTNDYLATDLALVNVTDTIPISSAGGSQQGIATDGTYIFVSNTTNIYKYSFDGTLLATSAAITDHFGGIDYYDGYIYGAESACPSSGTTSNHHIYKYDTDLQKVAEFDISNDFTICAGAIAYYNNNFYVAESYYDGTHYDRIVKYDTSFNYITTYTLNHQCSLGIQGFKYISPLSKFRLNCHSTEYFDIDTNFTNGSIQTGTSPFNLQDLSYVSGTTVLYNDRDSQVIKVISDSSFAMQNFMNVHTEYTASSWFNIGGSLS